MRNILVFALGFLSALNVEAADLNAVLCGPVCMIWCPFGNVMDEKGCPTCRCKSVISTTTEPTQHKLCSGVMCDIYCAHGHKIVDGCPVCACQTDETWVG
ncbi:antistasin-like [Ostrea edulis]|uniref:antistasin-like n=1 Tax=Ostrea edulis TaxID=37623 RepID=UPI002094BB3D|nr:antistasin-like [Ostrea edulis]